MRRLREQVRPDLAFGQPAPRGLGYNSVTATRPRVTHRERPGWAPILGRGWRIRLPRTTESLCEPDKIPMHRADTASSPLDDASPLRFDARDRVNAGLRAMALGAGLGFRFVAPRGAPRAAGPAGGGA